MTWLFVVSGAILLYAGVTMDEISMLVIGLAFIGIGLRGAIDD